MERQDQPRLGLRTPPRAAPTTIQWQRTTGVAERALAADFINPVGSESTTGFNAHAGEVMASPSVFAIYWGRDYGTPTSGVNARASSMDSFFTMVMQSTYLDMLGQYLVGRGTYLGSTWIDHQPSVAQTFTMNQMRDVLISWLDFGVSPRVPAWDERDLLFVIFAPSEVTLTDNSGGTGFCGYHWYGHYHNSPFQKDNLFFAVIGSDGDTATVGHELAEAFTDRSTNGWFSDDSPYSEIADTCSFCGSQTLTLNGFSLASYWLVNERRCLQQSDLTPGPLTTVPDVIGETASAASNILQSAGFAVNQQVVIDNTCERIGSIISQSPLGGSQKPQGSTVAIWIGAKPPHPCP